ncbi:PREDICTED: uncharacterized protein LOC109160437 [Ipomoea nil]|uniref:uncharacterized protein LOC109160437 n=1 Tax=Ipomoea nil TaxID=35883 RepID=UPI0009009CD3|nr:PREDICTED: uncharacterized protein LOC109160437 [Ipomoea nil]
MAPMYILARDNTPMKTEVAMKLRLVRTYDIYQSRDSDVIKCRECMFHNEQGEYVHFHIPKDHLCSPNTFVDGKVYCIKNFVPVTYFCTYKTSIHPYMLKFYHKTLVKEYKGTDYPRLLKSFASLKSLEGIDPKHLFDVIGRVVEIYSPLDVTIAGRPLRLIDFLIEDSNGNQMRCTMWDQHVDKVLPYWNSDEHYIHSSFSNGTLANSCYSTGKMVLSSISDIYERREFGEYWVACKINCIDSSIYDWYYVSCKSQGCFKKLDFKYGMYFCIKCGRILNGAVLRYKVRIRVVDVNVDYADFDDPIDSCVHCGAVFWGDNDQKSLHLEVVDDIKQVLDEHNVLVKSF